MLDPYYAAKTVGAPFFAYFAKGASRECWRKFVDQWRVITNQVA